MCMGNCPAFSHGQICCGQALALAEVDGGAWSTVAGGWWWGQRCVLSTAAGRVGLHLSLWLWLCVSPHAHPRSCDRQRRDTAGSGGEGEEACEGAASR